MDSRRRVLAVRHVFAHAHCFAGFQFNDAYPECNTHDNRQACAEGVQDTAFAGMGTEG